MIAAADEAAVLAAVLAEPDDDLHRHAYADLMEEKGDLARARLVRLQLELARRRAAKEPHWDFTFMNCRSRDCAVCMLRQEGGDIMGRYPSWLWPLTRTADGGRPQLNTANITDADLAVGVMAPSSIGFGYARGFAEVAALTLAQWLRAADALLALTPLRRVLVRPRIAGERESLVMSRYAREGGTWCHLADRKRSITLDYQGEAELTSRLLALEWPGVSFEDAGGLR